MSRRRRRDRLRLRLRILFELHRARIAPGAAGHRRSLLAAEAPSAGIFLRHPGVSFSTPPTTDPGGTVQ